MPVVTMTADELFEQAFGGPHSWEKPSQPVTRERSGIAELIQPHYPSTTLAQWIAYEEGRAQRPVSVGTPFEWRTPQVIYPLNYDGVLIEHDEATNTNRITTRLGGIETVRIERLDDIVAPAEKPEVTPITVKPQRKAKAISLWNPWALLVMLGLKKFETRHWKTDYRGTLVIHAAKRWTADEREWLDYFIEIFNLDVSPGSFMWSLRNESRYFGAALGTVELTQIYSTEHLRGHLAIDRPAELEVGNYDNNRFAWKLENVKMFAKPIPYKGHQGMWDWDLPLEDIA